MAPENLTPCNYSNSSPSMENKPKRPKLKIIPPRRRPDDDLTPDEVFAVEALLMLANGQRPTHQFSSSVPYPEKSSTSGHECKTCGMIFQSHQALGGHQTTHRTSKNIINTNNNNNNIVMNNNSTTHSCSICNKVFPSGQALGGHKRKHYDRDQDSSSCSNIITDFTSSNHHRGASLLNIDLNLPPAPEFC